MLLNISCSLDSRLVFQFPMAIGKTPTAREKTYIYTVVAGNLNYCTHINICWTACFYWQIASYLIGLIPFFCRANINHPASTAISAGETQSYGYTHVFHICFTSQSNELPISNGNIPPLYYTSIPSGVFTIFHGPISQFSIEQLIEFSCFQLKIL